jgi:protein-disulfide isomerase
MRIPCTLALLTTALLVFSTGCTTQVTGTATQDPAQPPLAVSDDGTGIVAGFPDAPVHIELFTEPQCDHCAALQHTYGDEIASYISLGELSVTYRFLTFLDDQPDEDYSWRVVTALFLAAEPASSTKDASGPEFQRFVEELWASQQPGGPGPSEADMADMATKAGLPAQIAQRIGDVDVSPKADIDDVAKANYSLLVQTNPSAPGTPLVYDLKKDEIVDIQETDWLDKLMSSSSS